MDILSENSNVDLLRAKSHSCIQLHESVHRWHALTHSPLTKAKTKTSAHGFKLFCNIQQAYGHVWTARHTCTGAAPHKAFISIDFPPPGGPSIRQIRPGLKTPDRFCKILTSCIGGFCRAAVARAVCSTIQHQNSVQHDRHIIDSGNVVFYCMAFKELYKHYMLIV
jgi:hypothetical protein